MPRGDGTGPTGQGPGTVEAQEAVAVEDEGRIGGDSSRSRTRRRMSLPSLWDNNSPSAGTPCNQQICPNVGQE